jgi:hypothetical protein
MAELDPNVSSKAWESGKAAAIKVFDQFAVQDEELKGRTIETWEQCIQKWKAGMCEPSIWQRLAHWLLHTYKQRGSSAKPHLSGTSARNYLSSIFFQTREKILPGGVCGQDDHVNRFFGPSGCLDTGGSSTEARWWKSLRDKLLTEAVLRDVEQGTSVDESAGILV